MKEELVKKVLDELKKEVSHETFYLQPSSKEALKVDFLENN